MVCHVSQTSGVLHMTSRPCLPAAPSCGRQTQACVSQMRRALRPRFWTLGLRRSARFLAHNA